MLVLASRSPRRRQLLRAAGYSLEVRAPRTDETTRPGETAPAAARRLAVEKAIAVARERPGVPVLAADTIVALGRRLLLKPEDDQDARRMLRLLSGRTHRVVTGVALAPAGAGRLRSTAVETRVTFRRLSTREIDWYVGTGEPFGKAGAYAIQGGASLFVTRLSGSYTNVVGLPMEIVSAWLGLPA